MGFPTPFPDPNRTQDAPNAVSAAEQQRLLLLELEDSETAELIRRWILVEHRLSPAVRGLVEAIIARREAGERLTRDSILALKETATFVASANAEYDSAIDDLEPTIVDHEREAISQGSIAARVLIAAVAIDMGRRAQIGVEDFEAEAIENFVYGLQSVNATLRILKGEQLNPIGMITDVIVAGSFSGFTQQAMFQAFMYEAGTQALAYFSLVMRDLLATRHRNAMEWVYRHTRANGRVDPRATTVGNQRNTRQAADQAEQDDDRLVMGWRRRCKRDFRVCPACVFLDGKLYPTNDLLEVHPNERCFMIPVLRGMPIPDWQTGREWFMQQSEATQIEIMGRGRYELWRDGGVDFDDFIQYTGETPGGQPGIKVRALKDMQPNASTRHGAGATRQGGKRTRPNQAETTEQAAFNQQTNRPNQTVDLNAPQPFPIEDVPPVPESALPQAFPTDAEIASAQRIQLGNTGVNSSYAVEVDGKRYFIKKVDLDQANAEVLNYEIAEQIGLNGRVPATRVVTFPDGSQGVIAEFATGARPIGALSLDEQRAFWRTLDDEQRNRFQLLEYINGNTDRHDMNFMVNPDTHDFFIIDSGASFGTSPFGGVRAYNYEFTIGSLNMPDAARYVDPLYAYNEMSIASIQAAIDRRIEIVRLVEAHYPAESVAALTARFDLLEALIKEMKKRGVTQINYSVMEDYLRQNRP